jgi:hypothetical protein
VGQVKSSDILSYGAPPVVPPAAQVYVADPAYAASASEHFNAYASGRCAFAGDPLCPCGAWRDTDGDGNWVSESYWCSNVSGGGWAEMDKGDGFWNGPVLPTNVTLRGGSDLAARAATWSPKARGEAVVTAWRAQGWFVDMFRVDDVVADGDGGATLTWSYGGFQGGRGWQVDGKKGIIDPLPPFYVENVREELDEADDGAGQESEIPNFKASYLGRFPLVSADFWTSDHLSERSRSVDVFSGTRARGTLTLKRR